MNPGTLNVFIWRSGPRMMYVRAWLYWLIYTNTTSGWRCQMNQHEKKRTPHSPPLFRFRLFAHTLLVALNYISLGYRGGTRHSRNAASSETESLRIREVGK